MLYFFRNNDAEMRKRVKITSQNRFCWVYFLRDAKCEKWIKLFFFFICRHPHTHNSEWIKRFKAYCSPS